jgi:glyceraldehyde 3-phosphate dehydrogenase
VKKLKVGINGFGRIGRILFRAGFDRLEFVGINNLGSAESAAHLLKYDSTHRKFGEEVSHGEDHLMVAGQRIPLTKEKDPSKIPWKSWGADVVLECTGAFKDKTDFMKHQQAGAKKVLVSAPAPGVDLTVVFGINQEQYDPSRHDVLSNASCTTNCLAPIAKVLQDTFGIESGLMTTIHSYTNDQRVLDMDHKDLRRARAAALSMIPTTTGAAKAVGEVLPELKGKIDGISIRVPTPDVSLVDFTAKLKKDVTEDSVNQALIQASSGKLKGILRCEAAPLVSSDFIGEPASSVVDLDSTMVVQNNMVKVFSWYDNEMGFSHRMVDLAIYMAEKSWS